MNKHYLYCIKNLINNKEYIGSSKEPARRFSEHERSKSPLGQAIQYFGTDAFSFDIICIGEKNFITDLEIKMIKAANSLVPNGYNIIDSKKITTKVSCILCGKETTIKGLNSPFHKFKRCSSISI